METENVKDIMASPTPVRKARARDNLIKKYRLPINVGTRNPSIKDSNPIYSSISYPYVDDKCTNHESCCGIADDAEPASWSKLAPLPERCHEIGEKSIPFNYCLNAVGGCAIKKIIFDGRDTIVLFDSGERTVVTCAETDTYDRMTAVAWGIMKCAFGRNCARQISKAIRAVGVDADEIRAGKIRRKHNCTAPAGSDIVVKYTQCTQ